MSEAPPQPGSTLGGWTLEELLQAGPRVSTWRATHGTRTCVLKLFAEPLDSAGRRAVQRAFRRAKGLQVEGIVAPDDLQNTPRGMLVSRARVEGTPLFAAIQEHRGPDQVSKAVGLAAELFATLARLHREGLVHGQLSPGNIWVMPDHTIQLTDIGSSEALLRSSHAELPGRLPPIAPEVAAGWGPRAATDVHAAGALLYAALATSNIDLTDRTTPWGVGASEALPPLPLRRPDVPLRLWQLIAQTQALDWAARPSAAELATALASRDAWTAPAPLPSCPRRIGQTEVSDAASRHLGRPGPRLVVISGPAGSGRHRLADTLMRHELRSHRPPVVVAADRAETGSLLIGTLRRVVGPDQHHARRRRLLRDHSPALVALWPELGQGEDQPAANTDARAVIDAATAVVYRSLADRPMFLVFDRLEDADPLSLRFVHYLLSTREDFRGLAIVDDRWQTDELRRMRSRMSDRAAVLEVTLPDLTAEEGQRVLSMLLRSMPEPPPVSCTAPASPARVTEQAHRHLSAWLDVPQPQPDATATLFAISDSLPTAAIRTLGMDPVAAIQHGIATPGHSGWLTRSHVGIEALGARGLARRDKLADRLAEALSTARADPGQIARVQLLGTTEARTVCARAAIAAHAADRPEQTRRWLHVVDRLPRDRTDTAYRALRAPLARVRAELAHLNPSAPFRADLIQQAVRRARSPDEQADLCFLLGLVELREGRTDAAERMWAEGTRPEASPTQQVRCAFGALSQGLEREPTPDITRWMRVLDRCATAPDLPRGPRRWLALGRSRLALHEGAAQHAVQHLKQWKASPDAAPDPETDALFALACHLAGNDTEAVAAVHALVDQQPFHAMGRLLLGWLGTLRGDVRAGMRAHRQLPDPFQPPLRLALEVRLAAAKGEHHHLVQLLGRPAPSRRSDLRAIWMTAVLDALRTIAEPGLRLARLDEAHTLRATSPWPALHLAVAWHHLDDHQPEEALGVVQEALRLARALDHPVHTLRATLLQAMLTGGHGWQALVGQAVAHPDTRVRHDVGELCARLALRTGDPQMAAQWVGFLSNEAVRAPDHGLAARATRVHRMVQAFGR